GPPWLGTTSWSSGITRGRARVPAGRVRIRKRERHLERRSSSAGLVHLDMSTVGGHDGVDDGKTKTRAASIPAPARVRAVEGFEDSLPVLEAKPRAVIDDRTL